MSENTRRGRCDALGRSSDRRRILARVARATALVCDTSLKNMGINDHDTFSGLAPLHKAAADGDLAKVIELMDDGADVDIRACGEVRDRARRARALDSRGKYLSGSFWGDVDA